LKKGDIVVVSQKEDGGWWEGTLKDKTGWFPSNYVREYKPQGKTLILYWSELRNNMYFCFRRKCFKYVGRFDRTVTS